MRPIEIMLRVLFDTNIYGLLIKEEDTEKIVQKIKDEKDFIVYGYRSIRRELQNIPKISKLSRRTRVQLLTLYDKITGKHFFDNSIEITKLAKKYYDAYRNNGGNYNWDTNIRIDFMIVACASFNGLDIIYSNDKKTSLGKPAIKAYKQINIKESFRTPYFLDYKNLLAKFRD